MLTEECPPQRILIVDDDPIVAAGLTLMLDSTAIATRLAASGMEAIDAAASWRPDLVILDIGLPDADGREICDAIRASRAVPVILVSGHVTEIEPADGVTFLRKPFGSEDLFNAMQGLGFLIPAL